MKQSFILILDRDQVQTESLKNDLLGVCPNIDTACDFETATNLITKNTYSIIITEIGLDSEQNGIDLLNFSKEFHPATDVIILTSSPTIDSCKESIRKGAYDYLVKPVDLDYLKVLIARSLSDKTRRYTKKEFQFDGILGHSKSMQGTYHVLRRVAPTSISVLIEGESGTGKELMARAIHMNSPRSDQMFVPINCAGLTESLLESELFGHSKGAFTGAITDRKGLFEMADKGTLFLDEIGDMPANMQAKLLRVLEDGVVVPVGSNKAVPVDVRIISATNHDLARLVEDNKFRQDLYFRIKGVSLSLPPLRNRQEDIEEFFGFFLKEACDETGRSITRITEPALTVLKGYTWPGNIRQLKHIVKMMVVLCESNTIDVKDIPPEVRHQKRLAAPQTLYETIETVEQDKRSLEDVEREHIQKILTLTDGNRAEASKILKIGERTLYRKIKEYNL